MNLTEHFTLEELTFSRTAAVNGVDNTPPPGVIDNLRQLARYLETLREFIGSPIRITSGYRCRELNKLVGGAADSSHMNGLAADLIIPQYGDPLMVCRKVVQTKLLFDPLDQLIHEWGKWTHVGLPKGPVPRNQQLTIGMHTQGKYVPGIFGA